MSTSKKRPEVYPLRGVITLHECGCLRWRRTTPPPPVGQKASLEFSFTATAEPCEACKRSRSGIILAR